ncbi:MAG: OmpH family outer membrane protein [Syntrophaceae bacterium]|nr:OmpH family outer membrane protein [Syntrophaceae bacterium]
MKKEIVMLIIFFVTVILTYSANAATIAYIDGQKVMSNYEKTKKAEEQFQKKDQILKEEVAKKQKQYEKAKSDNMSDGDLRRLVEKFEKELEPKRTEIIESQNKIMQEIRNDIIKATEATAKKMGFEIVLDKQSIIAGGTDITDEVIKQLNK